jgi:hypothetical protein
MAIHQVTPRRTHPQPYPKPALYEVISNVNRDLGQLIEDFERLRDFRFKRSDIDSFIAKAEHLRARANAELLERQLDRELKDEHHFSMLDKKFEDRFLDPDDVLIGAERRLEEMAKQERYALREAHELRDRRERAEKQLRPLIPPPAPAEPDKSTESED